MLIITNIGYFILLGIIEGYFTVKEYKTNRFLLIQSVIIMFLIKLFGNLIETSSNAENHVFAVGIAFVCLMVLGVIWLIMVFICENKVEFIFWLMATMIYVVNVGYIFRYW